MTNIWNMCNFVYFLSWPLTKNLIILAILLCKEGVSAQLVADGVWALGCNPGQEKRPLFKACVLRALWQHATKLPGKMLPCVAHGTRKALLWDPAWPPSSLKTGGEMVECRFSGLPTIAAARKDFPSDRRQFGRCALFWETYVHDAHTVAAVSHCESPQRSLIMATLLQH